MAESSSAGTSANLLSDFVGVALHQILYARKVYPREIFERRRFLDVTVFRSRHAELNDYLATVVRGTRQLLERGEADAVVLSIYGSARGDASATAPHVLERFRLELRMPVAGHLALPDSAHALDALRGHLRGFVLKLHLCESLLAPLPPSDDLNFTVELHTRETSCAEPLPAHLLEQWSECNAVPMAETGAAAHGRGAPSSLDSSLSGGRAPYVVPIRSAALDGGLTIALSALTAAMPPPP